MPDISTKVQRRLVTVWTRDVDHSRLAGRTRIIASIRELMSRNYQTENRRLSNLIEHPSLAAVVGAMSIAIRSLLSGDFPSLQCLLYCNWANHREIRRALRAAPPETLYLDGVRSFYFLRSLGKLRQRMKIVIDMDDLMSRRMESLGKSGSPLSLGYLRETLPPFLSNVIALNSISKAIARYERRALIRVEDLLGRWADVVTLVSSVEAEALLLRYQGIEARALVRAIPPPVAIVVPPQTYSTFSRFIFIGTDSLPQNRLTIQLILDLWQRCKPKAEIHIFGHMVTRWPSISNVVFRGYAPSLKEVYVDGAVMFAPGVLPGGLKTKVAEAFANGCCVVGNDITFEGLSMLNYPLLVDGKESLEALAICPSVALDRMRRSAALGQIYVRSFLSWEQFERSWTITLG